MASSLALDDLEKGMKKMEMNFDNKRQPSPKTLGESANRNTTYNRTWYMHAPHHIFIG